ncbi:MAG: four helix bundle protein [Cytophagia bacterium]|nr:four helix bundle protein [Cytophagia bacterium]
MHNYKELKVWQEAIDLTESIYLVSAKFPSEEKFGLTSQIRRASVSVPSNISEGSGRNSKGEFKQFLGIANGSLCEVETQLIIAEKLNIVNESEELEGLFDKIDHIQKMIFKLKNTLN